MSKVIQTIRVGIADLNVVTEPDVIRTSGLGSCVGVVIYDRITKIAGMAHIMLPDSTMAKQGDLNRSKYADTAVDDLVQKLQGMGAAKYRFRAKMAGGAQMFQLKAASDMMRIGPRNVEAVKRRLAQFRIPIEGEDVGGKSGRTVEFDPSTTIMNIRTVNQGESTI